MEAVNGVQDTGGPPPPSPLTGCYLLIVIGEPHSQEHKNIILQRIAKGLLSWDITDCLIDLEKELAIITEQAPEGEEARYGERLIQYASENLVTEVLIHPAVSTLAQCVRNLLSSFTRHRHIIHAGYTFAANGSWILQDGTFSYTDFAEAFHEIEVQRVIRAYENSISVDVHCSPEGDWTRLPKESFAKNCKVRVNAVDVLNSGSPSITNFLNYISPFLIPVDVETLLECSDVVGNIRFSHPTLYIFPGGQGDAALFGINGFNMLLDGGFSRKACFWDFVRHLDRLDAVMLTRLNNGNASGISAVLRRKMQNALYPQIGHFFCNIQERKSILSPDGDKDKDPLLINLLDEGQEIITNLKKLNLSPQICYRDSEPINLYHKVGHGTLDMYVLSPAKDSKEVKDFLQRWNTNDQKLFANQRNSKDFQFPLQNMVSICALLIWQPANPNDNITRILYPGSTPQQKIFEGLDRLKNLEYIKYPVCSESKLVTSSSIIALKSKQLKDASLEKLIQPESKKFDKLKEKPPKFGEIKKMENKLADNLEKQEMTNGVSSENETDKTVKKSDSTDSEKSTKSTKLKKLDEKIDDKKTKPESKPKAKTKIDSKPERKKFPEKKASPTTPKKTIEAKTNGELKEKEKPIAKPIKYSPSATPAKSAKEATNRKVIESKNKMAAKKEVKPLAEKKESKPERKPISRRAKGPSPTTKTVSSPIKKVNGVQKPDIIKKAKLDKEGTTDSSTVSTPSADQKDIAKLTPEELEQLKAQELADLKEEQEVVKEIEAVFRKGEVEKTSDVEARKIKDISIEDKSEPEEYLIVEKEEVEHDSLEDKDNKEDETQKHARDSEESEKMRKLSDDIKISLKEKEELAKQEEEIAEEEEIVTDIKAKEDKEKPIDTSKEISVTSPEDRVDMSVDKKDIDNQEQNVALESQPDERYSATAESGATTAPTLPEDERITLDEIKEDNGDQAIEEKHVKEDTKEKDVPIIQLPSKTFETAPKLPPVVGIRLDKQTHIRDIVKTPDEVADLPVHEEADIEQYHMEKIHLKEREKTEEDIVEEKEKDTTIEKKEETDINIEEAKPEEKIVSKEEKFEDIKKEIPDIPTVEVKGAEEPKEVVDILTVIDEKTVDTKEKLKEETTESIKPQLKQESEEVDEPKDEVKEIKEAAPITEKKDEVKEIKEAAPITEKKDEIDKKKDDKAEVTQPKMKEEKDKEIIVVEKLEEEKPMEKIKSELEERKSPDKVEIKEIETKPQEQSKPDEDKLEDFEEQIKTDIKEEKLLKEDKQKMQELKEEVKEIEEVAIQDVKKEEIKETTIEVSKEPSHIDKQTEKDIATEIKEAKEEIEEEKETTKAVEEVKVVTKEPEEVKQIEQEEEETTKVVEEIKEVTKEPEEVKEIKKEVEEIAEIKKKVEDVKEVSETVEVKKEVEETVEVKKEVEEVKEVKKELAEAKEVKKPVEKVEKVDKRVEDKEDKEELAESTKKIKDIAQEIDSLTETVAETKKEDEKVVDKLEAAIEKEETKDKEEEILEKDKKLTEPNLEAKVSVQVEDKSILEKLTEIEKGDIELTKQIKEESMEFFEFDSDQRSFDIKDIVATEVRLIEQMLSKDDVEEIEDKRVEKPEDSKIPDSTKALKTELTEKTIEEKPCVKEDVRDSMEKGLLKEQLSKSLDSKPVQEVTLSTEEEKFEDKRAAKLEESLKPLESKPVQEVTLSTEEAKFEDKRVEKLEELKISDPIQVIQKDIDAEKDSLKTKTIKETVGETPHAEEIVEEKPCVKEDVRDIMEKGLIKEESLKSLDGERVEEVTVSTEEEEITYDENEKDGQDKPKEKEGESIVPSTSTVKSSEVEIQPQQPIDKDTQPQKEDAKKGVEQVKEHLEEVIEPTLKKEEVKRDEDKIEEAEIIDNEAKLQALDKIEVDEAKQESDVTFYIGDQKLEKSKADQKEDKVESKEEKESKIEEKDVDDKQKNEEEQKEKIDDVKHEEALQKTESIMGEKKADESVDIKKEVKLADEITEPISTDSQKASEEPPKAISHEDKVHSIDSQKISEEPPRPASKEEKVQSEASSLSLKEELEKLPQEIEDKTEKVDVTKEKQIEYKDTAATTSEDLIFDSNKYANGIEEAKEVAELDLKEKPIIEDEKGSKEIDDQKREKEKILTEESVKDDSYVNGDIKDKDEGDEGSEELISPKETSTKEMEKKDVEKEKKEDDKEEITKKGVAEPEKVGKDDGKDSKEDLKEETSKEPKEKITEKATAEPEEVETVSKKDSKEDKEAISEKAAKEPEEVVKDSKKESKEEVKEISKDKENITEKATKDPEDVEKDIKKDSKDLKEEIPKATDLSSKNDDQKQEKDVLEKDKELPESTKEVPTEVLPDKSPEKPKDKTVIVSKEILLEEPKSGSQTESPETSSEQALQTFKENELLDKSELGRKSPKEREQDVAKIVASVAEVLKSDAPLEEFEGKIPLTIAPFVPFTATYTTELRETHITTVDSPVSDFPKEIIESDIEPKALPETIVEKEEEEVERKESKLSDLMRDSRELMEATSKMISDIKSTKDPSTDAEEPGTVHRMLVTASSEDGGEEIEICAKGSITFTKSTDSSGRSSPETQKLQGKDEDKIPSGKSTPDIKITTEQEKGDVESTEKELSDQKSSGKASPELREESPTPDSGITETAKQDLPKSGKSTPDAKDKSSLIELDKKSTDSGRSTPEAISAKMETLEEPSLKVAFDSGRSTPDSKCLEEIKEDENVDAKSTSGKSTPDISKLPEDQRKSSVAGSKTDTSSEKSSSQEIKKDVNSITEASDLTSVSELKDSFDAQAKEDAQSSEGQEDRISEKERSLLSSITDVSGKSTPDVTQSIMSGKSTPDLKPDSESMTSRTSTPGLKDKMEKDELEIEVTSKETIKEAPTEPIVEKVPKEVSTKGEEKQVKKETKLDTVEAKEIELEFIDDTKADEIPPAYEDLEKTKADGEELKTKDTIEDVKSTEKEVYTLKDEEANIVKNEVEPQKTVEVQSEVIVEKKEATDDSDGKLKEEKVTETKEEIEGITLKEDDKKKEIEDDKTKLKDSPEAVKEETKIEESAKEIGKIEAPAIGTDKDISYKETKDDKADAVKEIADEKESAKEIESGGGAEDIKKSVTEVETKEVPRDATQISKKIEDLESDKQVPDQPAEIKSEIIKDTDQTASIKEISDKIGEEDIKQQEVQEKVIQAKEDVSDKSTAKLLESEPPSGIEKSDKEADIKKDEAKLLESEPPSGIEKGDKEADIKKDDQIPKVDAIESKIIEETKEIPTEDIPKIKESSMGKTAESISSTDKADEPLIQEEKLNIKKEIGEPTIIAQIELPKEEKPSVAEEIKDNKVDKKLEVEEESSITGSQPTVEVADVQKVDPISEIKEAKLIIKEEGTKTDTEERSKEEEIEKETGDSSKLEMDKKEVTEFKEVHETEKKKEDSSQLDEEKKEVETKEIKEESVTQKVETKDSCKLELEEKDQPKTEEIKECHIEKEEIKGSSKVEIEKKDIVETKEEDKKEKIEAQDSSTIVLEETIKTDVTSSIEATQSKSEAKDVEGKDKEVDSKVVVDELKDQVVGSKKDDAKSVDSDKKHIEEKLILEKLEDTKDEISKKIEALETQTIDGSSSVSKDKLETSKEDTSKEIDTDRLEKDITSDKDLVQKEIVDTISKDIKDSASALDTKQTDISESQKQDEAIGCTTKDSTRESEDKVDAIVFDTKACELTDIKDESAKKEESKSVATTLEKTILESTGKQLEDKKVDSSMSSVIIDTKSEVDITDGSDKKTESSVVKTAKDIVKDLDVGKEKDIKEAVKVFIASEKDVSIVREIKDKDQLSSIASSSKELTKSEETGLSGKSTPDIADVERDKQLQETLTYEKHIPGCSTPPTVPVSPIVKDMHPDMKSSLSPEKKLETSVISSVREQDFRSATPGSDDCEHGVSSTHSDISSSQMSRAPNLLEGDETRESDEDDILGSPTSVTSQIGHSPSSQYDFDDDKRLPKTDPMSASFYGTLPGDVEDSGFKSGKFIDDSDLDFEKAMQEHRQTRGEDLTGEQSYLYEITTAKYTSASSAIAKEDLGKKTDIMTSSFIGTELPGRSTDDKDKDPIGTWGKPLGLPSPAPPDNKGTPKKEKKLPPNVTAKNKLNDDKKRSESPSKYDKKPRKGAAPIYVDLTYVPHHGNSNYSYVDFFKRIRARYYVFSGIEPSKEVYNALLEAKQTWEDKDLEVTIIPTYDTDVLGYWVAENEELLTKYKIDLSPSASRCTINLQDHETSCSAYRLEF